MSDTVAAVVVTYNRKELLIECLEAIRNQTHKPDAIFIIDNKSSDGTPELLLEKNYICKLPEKYIVENQIIKHQVSSLNTPSANIQINYIRKFQNDGGAGGFYEGMKQAYEAGYDWLWMMDDDGFADKNQLLELLKVPNKYKYRNALVVDINYNSKLAFGLKGYNNVYDITETQIIEDEVNPFNGTFINREIPEKIGFIKKEMFIWGDETEYTKKAISNNFKVATVISSLHFHPSNKGKWECIIPALKKYKILIKPEALHHIYYRNISYINYHYNKTNLLKYFIIHTAYFIVRLKIKEYFKFIKYSIKGIKDDFS